MNPIQGIKSLPLPPSAGGIGTGASQATQPSKPFEKFLVDSIQEVNAMQQDADHAVGRGQGKIQRRCLRQCGGA